MEVPRGEVFRVGTRLRPGALVGFLMASVIAALVLVVAQTPPVGAADALFSGVVDDDRVLGPRWTSADFTPTESGPVTISLSWIGDGDLAMSLRVVATDTWVTSNTTSESPKTMIATLTGGVSYRIGVWSREGNGTFELTTTVQEPGELLLTGDVDSTRTNAPKWVSTIFTPSSSGTLRLELAWTGNGNLATNVRQVEGDVWITSNTSDDSPKSITADVTAGVQYRAAVWSLSGTGTFELVLHGPDGPPPTSAPNIVVINVDDARPEALEVLPKVVAWFGEGGTNYENAYVSTPSCCPSRASLMTGQYVHNNGQRDQNTPSTNEDHTIQRYLSEAGYFTAHSGKYLHYYPTSSRAPYWDRWTYFKGSYYNVWVNKDDVVTQSAVYSTVMTFDSAISYAEQFDALDDDRPFYLQITPVAPHRPWEPDTQYVDAVIPTWSPAPSVGEVDRSDKPPWVRYLDYSEAEASIDRVQQLRTMLSVDDQVDRLMTRLTELGEADNTIAIFTSDNGMFWAEHGRSGKFLPYDEAVEVPFLVRWPGRVPAGVTSSELISHVDVLPTLMNAAGVGVDHTVDGRDFLDPAFDRDDVLTEYWEDPANNNGVPDWASIRNQERMYSEYYDGSGTVIASEYYDLASDPWELVNLLDDGDGSNDPDITGDQALLHTYRTCSGETCP